MFDYSLVHWTTFLSAAVLLNLAPGPDIAFILGKTVRGGRADGFAAILGIWTGAFGHVLMAALGLSAILATSATAFSAVKWAGAAYLVWLGIRTLRSGVGTFVAAEGAKAKSFGAICRQGILVALLNPKVAVFFLAFLPQFVVEGAEPVSAQLFLHGTLIIVVAAFIEPPLVIAGARLVKSLQENRRFGLWLDRTLGAMFIALGIKLVLTRQ